MYNENRKMLGNQNKKRLKRLGKKKKEKEKQTWNKYAMKTLESKLTGIILL